jgi:hypothetical protein
VQDWDGFFLGGRWQPAVGTDRVEVVSPASLKVVGSGFKNSGFGREGGTEALDDYTESQTIILPGQANRREQAA